MVEVVVAPKLGRVMQFGFRGEEGVFWENSALEGKELSCENKEWINFGGDKTWPAPESDWGKFTGRTSWRPPSAFDCLPLDGATNGPDVILTSRVDPHYGLRSVRRIRLNPVLPEMTIETTYERIWGEPAPIGIWVITQLKEPVAAYAVLPELPDQLKDFIILSKERAPSLRIANGLASLTRDSAAAYKVGFESSTLIWIGDKHGLRIDSPRTQAPYPDKGSSAEIYTNPDPLRYVELETLGPLAQLKPGDKISHTNRYLLFRRTLTSPDREVRRVLAIGK